MQEAFRIIDEDGIRNVSEAGRRVGIHHRTLKNLLGNPYVVGIRSYTKIRDQSRKSVKAGGRQKDRPKIERRPDQIIRVRIIPENEQAVTQERFDRVQQFLAEIADKHERFVAPHKGINLLSSIGRCGKCGERLYTVSSSRRAPDGSKSKGHYICKSHYYLFRGKLPSCSQGWTQREKADQLISAFFARFLSDPEFLEAILVHARSKQKGSVIAMASAPELIRSQLADIEKRDRRLLDAIETGAISLAEVKQRRQRLEEQKQALLRSMQDSGVAGDSRDLPAGVIGRIASMDATAWAALTCPRERKKLVSAIFMEIYVDGESITAFRLAPSLVGSDSGDWGWVADIPVTLPEPFRLEPAACPVELPPGHRQCTRCLTALPPSGFYGKRPACRECEKKANNARYAAKVAAAKAKTLTPRPLE
ncbi:MAG: hypothetical protein EOP83_19265 [Verrucomicrobiaceae bacterium]|nr:MAG: hypothetical protein EOP83_19265 [Verrucomicrobiaceae bacterium]